MEVPATTQAKPKKQGFFGHYVKTKLKEASKNKTLYLFMLPFLVLFVIFTVMPVVTAIYYSFTYFNVLEPPQFIFWDNYVRMFVADDLFMTAFKNTLLFAAILGPCGYILSFFFAWLINEFSPKIRAVLTLIYYAPSLANIYVVWKSFKRYSDGFGPDLYQYPMAGGRQLYCRLRHSGAAMVFPGRILPYIYGRPSERGPFPL